MKFTFPPESSPLDGYTIKRAIHRGGFGEVYYALSNAGKEVALKLLNNNLDVELRGVSQCLNLKHPNLVTIFDIRQDSDQDHWVIMEYVGGKGLYETLRAYPSGMPLNEVVHWLHGISAGLAFLHDRGIVHRDLKPANVFQDADQVKVGDVGLSKYISESNRSAQTQSVGTVYYMAPEVARGRYGKEVDVYAMGIMLYEMLTGRVPFEGETTAEILMKHLTGEPDLTVLPAMLQAVLGNALEKDPLKRTASIQELERLFLEAAAEEGVNTQKPLFAAAAKPTPNFADPAQPAMGTFAAEAHTDSNTNRPYADRNNADRNNPDRNSADNLGQQEELTGIKALSVFWNSIPAPLQWVIGGATALLVLESGMIRPVAVGGLIGGGAYLSYQFVTGYFGRGDKKKAAPDHSPRAYEATSVQPELARTVVPGTERRKRASLKTLTPATKRSIPAHLRFTDVTTSATMALVATLLVTTAIFYSTNLLTSVAHAVYFAAITIVASWAIIIPSKLREGHRGDCILRRMGFAVIGLGIGFLAAELPNFLMIEPGEFLQEHAQKNSVKLGQLVLADASGYPTTACFMLFFAGLFAVRRWWWQSDSYRKSRFRVTSALLTLLAGAVIAGVMQDLAFPDSMGATWALAISSVVQLSSGWTPLDERLGLQPT
ncbi:MAG: serine/threonine-protein kinase [Fuerstiella sp.]